MKSQEKSWGQAWLASDQSKLSEEAEKQYLWIGFLGSIFIGVGLHQGVLHPRITAENGTIPAPASGSGWSSRTLGGRDDEI
jgi:hypothetical protein